MRTMLTLLIAVMAFKASPAAAAKKKPAPAPKKASAPASSHHSETGPTSPEAPVQAPSRGPSRIDFDDRLVQGQTNKSGAVYLYDRKELKVRSMVQRRENFREEILSSVYEPQG